MLAATPKTKRFLELTQLVLTFASVCAVVDSSRIDEPPAGRPGYQADAPRERDAAHDRRFGDLARVERKRREAEQRAHRRSGALSLVAIAHAAIDPGRADDADKPGARPSLPHSSICATCPVSETLRDAAALQHDQHQVVTVHSSLARVLQPPPRTA